ncbi:MAG: 50S ribosomal protein L3 N(5)-glutamine methyltransferase [Betaproteobacteria bacterium]|nr:50S ribosomal protein L3 N(5)-glutamine methyltransferase [Betaproteobacteria bacterium]
MSHHEYAEHEHEHDPRDELVTVRDLIRYAVSRFNRAELFFGHGSISAFDEAVYLILHRLHLPLDRLEPFLDACIPSDERGEVLDLIDERVSTRKPAAYLTHEAWLGDFRFYVDERVIVPRSYFAELLETGLSPWIENPEAVYAALDLCTGSGCLAVLMANAFPAAKIDAVDLSSAALEVARRNVDDYGLEHRIELIQSDLFAELAGRSYDLILTNPPYVTTAVMRDLPAEYRHEPEMALAAGEDGLDAVRRILAEAPKYLNPHGLLAVEVGHNRDRVETAWPTLPLFWLNTENHDEAIFVIHREDLLTHSKSIKF